MTSDRRFEQDLPSLFGQLADGPDPDYRDQIVRETARTRQRPAWTFPERWLTVTPVVSQVAFLPRIPWRMIALAALLLVALAVGTVLISGSRPRVPAPFGPATTGLVAYSADGDIYTANHATGAATPIVRGTAWDTRPVWFRDGTGLVFERKDGDGPFATAGRLVVVDANGSHLGVITPSLAQIAEVGPSPAGDEVAFTAGPAEERQLWVAATDGSGARMLAAAAGLLSPAFAPAGGDILYAAGPAEAGVGIYAVSTSTGRIREIVAPTPGTTFDWIRPSPDGSRIAYAASTGSDLRNTYQVHVVSADGGEDLTLPMPPGAVFQDGPAWSNDGTRLAITRGYAGRDEDMAMAVVPADGSGTGIETVHGMIGCCDTTIEWSPDDLAILILPSEPGIVTTQQLLWDPVTGTLTPSGWSANSQPSWQRR